MCRVNQLFAHDVFHFSHSNTLILLFTVPNITQMIENAKTNKARSAKVCICVI